MCWTYSAPLSFAAGTGAVCEKVAQVVEVREGVLQLEDDRGVVRGLDGRNALSLLSLYGPLYLSPPLRYALKYVGPLDSASGAKLLRSTAYLTSFEVIGEPSSYFRPFFRRVRPGLAAVGAGLAQRLREVRDDLLARRRRRPA